MKKCNSTAYARFGYYDGEVLSAAMNFGPSPPAYEPRKDFPETWIWLNGETK